MERSSSAVDEREVELGAIGDRVLAYKLAVRESRRPCSDVLETRLSISTIRFYTWRFSLAITRLL